MTVFRVSTIGSLLLLIAGTPATVSAQDLSLPDVSTPAWASNVSVRLRTGTTYFDLPSDSRVGGTWGADFSVPVRDQWGAYAGFSLNHFSGGSQFLGTLGGFRSADPDSHSPLGRMSGMLLFDQFTDSRFGKLYISQLRVSLGYALSHSLGAGVQYSQPVSEDKIDSFLNPGFSSQVRSARSVSGFTSVRIRDAMLTGLLGYRDSNSTIAGARLRLPINQRLSAYSSTQYDSQGFWAGSAGVEIELGRRSRPLGLTHGDNGRRTIRGQSPDSMILAPWIDPTLGDALSGATLMSPSSLIVTRGSEGTNPGPGTSSIAPGEWDHHDCPDPELDKGIPYNDILYYLPLPEDREQLPLPAVWCPAPDERMMLPPEYED